MARLQLNDLCFSVNALDILRSVNMTVDDGKCLALLGPSGCGKTTTLRCIAGFVQPTSGDVNFDGDSILEQPIHKRNVGLVFQDYALFPHMTVEKNIAYGLERRRAGTLEIKRRVKEMLDLVQLDEYATRIPKNMSGGQQQRVALARALVIRPNVLLLDEPLGALDRKLRDQMQVEMKRIQRETGTTTIIVTHDQEEALSLSDQVAVMFDGRIQEVGAPAKLYQKPGSRAVMEFLGASNILGGTVARSSAEASLVSTANGIEFRVPGKQVEGSSVEIGIRPEHIAVTRTKPEATENIFSGVISEVVYKGPHAELYINTNDRQMIVAHKRMRGMKSEDIYSIGEQVFLSVELGAVIVFK
jgi:spermidine/putrescine ABC transporter ATP-binding subunit